MPTSANDVQQAITNVNQVSQSLSGITDQYLNQLGSLNQAMMQSSSLVAGAIQDPSFQAAVQQAIVQIGNFPAIIDEAKMKVSSQLDSIGQATEQLNIAMQSMQQVPVTPEVGTFDASQQGLPTPTSQTSYNFKKAQLNMGGFGNPQPEPAMSQNSMPQDPMGFGPFNDASELLQKLEGMDRSDAENKILSYVSDPTSQEQIRKGMEMVFEHDLNDQQQLEVTSQLWDLLPDAIKANTEDLTPVEGTLVQNQEQTMASLENIKKMVEASNEGIKKLAQSGKGKSYNFKKQAQHKTNENVILWGPESRRIDPFTGEPISDWHVFERNRGWGFRIGDRWDIDFEAFWRGNIMDKYHRPYRDEDGNWVGGYIEKRFEVDRWQPEENKYMLKPGEIRKPRPAELGNMEARMEAYRGNKAYNWAEANSKRMVKTSQMNFEDITGGQLPAGIEEITPNRFRYKGFEIVAQDNSSSLIQHGGDPNDPNMSRYIFYPESGTGEQGTATNLQDAVAKIDSTIDRNIVASSKKKVKLASGSKEAGSIKLPPIDTERYPKREGLEGPFRRRSGKVLYYDTKEGSYYDPDTDMYISPDELMWHDSPRDVAASSRRFTKIASATEEHIARQLKKKYDELKSTQNWLDSNSAVKLVAKQYYQGLSQQAQEFLGDTPEEAIGLLEQTLEDVVDYDHPLDGFPSIRASKKKSLRAYNLSKGKLEKTALDPLPAKKDMRRPPGAAQLHGPEKNMSAQGKCGICGSDLDLMSGQCPNCDADSKNFTYAPPKIDRDKPNLKQPAPQQQGMRNQRIAINLDNREVDDPKVFDKKKKKKLDKFPKLTEHGWNTVEENNMLEPVEKAFSDPDDPENSDKNHMSAVERTWADLCGDE